MKSQRKLKITQQTLSNTKEIRNHLYNIENKLDKKIINNDDFTENVRDLFNIENSDELD